MRRCPIEWISGDKGERILRWCWDSGDPAQGGRFFAFALLWNPWNYTVGINVDPLCGVVSCNRHAATMRGVTAMLLCGAVSFNYTTRATRIESP